MINTYILLGFFIRLLNSIWNGFFGPSIGAESDALGYYFKAVEYSSTLKLDGFVMGDIYAYALGILFYLTTPSIFVASLASTFAWLGSAYILKNIFTILSFNARNQRNAMLFFALLPSSVMFTSIPLREAYQLLFVSIAFFSILKITMQRRNSYWMLLLLAVAGMGVLHGALFAFGIFILIATILINGRFNRNKHRTLSNIAMIMLSAIIITAASLIFSNVSYELGDGLDIAAQAYQSSAIGMDGRTNYKTSASFLSPYDFLLSLPYSTFQYLFEPMPWHITAITDYVILIENLLKIYLIFFCIKIMRKNSDPNILLLRFIFASWIVINVIWSIGTVNWGTSSRHQIPGMGLLIASAFWSKQILNGKSKYITKRGFNNE